MNWLFPLSESPRKRWTQEYKDSGGGSETVMGESGRSAFSGSRSPRCKENWITSSGRIGHEETHLGQVRTPGLLCGSRPGL